MSDMPAHILFGAMLITMVAWLLFLMWAISKGLDILTTAVAA